MPHFYFHFRDVDRVESDDIGIECSSVEEAYLEACEAIPGVLGDVVQAGRDPRACAFEIANAAGQHLMQVPLLEPIRSARRRAA